MINLELEEEDIEDIPMDDEDVGVGVEMKDVKLRVLTPSLSFLNRFLRTGTRPRCPKKLMKVRSPYTHPSCWSKLCSKDCA